MLSSSCEGLGLRYKSLYLSGPSEPAVPNFFPGGVIFFQKQREILCNFSENNAEFYGIYVILNVILWNLCISMYLCTFVAN